MPLTVQTNREVKIIFKKIPLNRQFWVCISAPFVQMSREVNIKKYKFFKNTPKKAFSVQTSEGVIKKHWSKG